MLSAKGLSIKPITQSQSTINSIFGKQDVICKWIFQITDTFFYVSTIFLHSPLSLKMIWYWLPSSPSEITFIKHYFYLFLRPKASMMTSAVILELQDNFPTPKESYTAALTISLYPFLGIKLQPQLWTFWFTSAVTFYHHYLDLKRSPGSMDPSFKSSELGY